MKPIQMVDLQSQYKRLQNDIDAAIKEVLESAAYINGPAVKLFQSKMESYLDVKHVIPCANGTDALQIALMALDLKPGDEIIVPAFTYVATAEVAALLGLTVVMVDCDPDTFNVSAQNIEVAITTRTKAIVPVHLFGQSCDMDAIMDLAKRHNLYVIEDNAQAIGSDYSSNDKTVKTGTIGHIGCTSFYPSKNLGAYGDGGAIFCNDDELAGKLRMIASHGQVRRYYHDLIGVNSRLDSIQAALLEVKLRYLDDFAKARQKVAAYYDKALSKIEGLTIPARQENATHVFHQYTLQVPAEKRNMLQEYLKSKDIPSMVYYPLPLYEQSAFKDCSRKAIPELPVTEQLCRTVISLPIHTEMEEEQLKYICDHVLNYFS